ncbi:hypothetical protein F4808DRAFT_406844 [Astrocystis sublimbata]|nr:hypothetical protein F4808DRAFT_406844 [Astrocystis sublimbata]
MMERNLSATGGVLTTKPNGRKGNTQPLGSRRLSSRGSVKGSGRRESKENATASDAGGGARPLHRPASSGLSRHRHSESLIEHPSPSPSLRVDRSTAASGTPAHSQSTRIPRPASVSASRTADSDRRDIPNHRDPPPDQSQDPSSPMRQPMSLRAAFKRAQEQAAAEENTDSDNTIDLQQAFQMANAEFNTARGIDGSPSPAPRSLRRDFQTSVPSKTGVSARTSDLGSHLERFDQNHRLTGRSGPLTGLFPERQGVPAVPAEGQSLAVKSGASSLDDKSARRRPSVRSTGLQRQDEVGRNGALVEGVPAASAISGGVDADIPVNSIENEHDNTDASLDFGPSATSPEKNPNWHLDADFTAEDLQISESPRIAITKPSLEINQPVGPSVSRQSNDRLDRIQQREAEAAKMNFPENAQVLKQLNQRLEEIRAREAEALSRRAVASSRLDEIRIRNSEPRSESPEFHENREHHENPLENPLEEGMPLMNNARPSSSRSKSELENRGEPIHDTPVVARNKSLSDKPIAVSGQDAPHDRGDKRGSLSRNDSHDLLRRLARATSSSPKDTPKPTGQDKGMDLLDKLPTKPPFLADSPTRSASTQEARKVRHLEAKSFKDKPTVLFADMIDFPSRDSVEEKQTSKPTSEVDPTDRITAELNLFAPLDNYSEKGSTKAPSPVPSELMIDETPRPSRTDPLLRPTPRVAGAYIDTPATVRVTGNEGTTRANSSSTHSTVGSDDKDRAISSKHSGPRSSSVPTASRRSRSLSRRRRPLINTAKPPTVRDDILAILRSNNIDDSTLENLDSILTDQAVDDQELKKMVNDSVLKVEDDLDVKLTNMSDREQELEAYDRMSKSLQTGLLGIRSAKKGIERLEDKVIKKGSKDDQAQAQAQAHPKPTATAQPPVQPSVPSDEAAHTLIPVPRLYRRNPTFKLTKFGIITTCFTIWYVLECIFCYHYAGPEYMCTPTIPCNWSPNEPYFPYTMPFMLDEWATGGKGRAAALRLGEEVGDICAEISDWVTNTDFTQYDELYMDVWQRNRHRRRLRRHALNPKWTEPPGYTARYPEWQAAKAAREAAREYELNDEDIIGDDEIVW